MSTMVRSLRHPTASQDVAALRLALPRHHGVASAAPRQIEREAGRPEELGVILSSLDYTRDAAKEEYTMAKGTRLEVG